MTHTPEDFAGCSVNWSNVSVVLDTMPPRDPNDDDDDDEDDDEHRDNEPAVVREPDEDK